MLVCSQCGHENAADARFCNECAAPLASPAAETRKTVTVVFCDLVGSTSLGDRTDPEVLRTLMGHYHAALRRCIEAHGGTVEKFIGDAAMAVFGLPHVHEDDALRAVRSAIAMREAVRSLGLEVRIGINTGEVVAGAGETLVTGDAVNVAARLEQHAETGQILIGTITERLVRDHVAVEPIAPLLVKGKDEPLVAYCVVQLHAPRAAATVSPFVGRETELESIEQAVRTASDKRTPQLVTIVGAPGIGKSRLVAETLARVDGQVLVGRCLSYGDAITYWPLVEVLEAVGDIDRAIDEHDAALVSVRLAAAMGTPGAAASPDEIAWAFRRLVESLAREELLVVVFDDIHWAEPTLLDLIEYVATFTQDSPVVLLCTARPDLFEVRPDWAAPRHNATLIRLEPLDMSQADSLVHLIGDVPPEVRQRIVDASDGNPLFVEQLVAMHEESNSDELEIPPNLQALLGARIDRLEAEERLVIERASVEGRLFHRGAVMELLPEPNKRDLGARLMGLVRREFIRPDRATISGDDGFRFGHILIRDAAYDSVPKRTRAELHEKYANWLLERLGDDAPPEIVGYHLEQSCRYARELGQTIAPCEEAADHLKRAGDAARLRRDVSAAVRFYQRANDLAVEPRTRGRILIALAEAHMDTGDLDGLARAVDEARQIADATDDTQLALLAQTHQAYLHLRRTAEGATDLALQEADRALASADPDDHFVLSRVWWLLTHAHNLRGNVGEQWRAVNEAVDHARAIGDLQWEIAVSGGWAGAIVYGPVSVDEGFTRAAHISRDLGHIPAIQGMVLHVLAHLRARRGDFGAADEALHAWREHMLELGHEALYATTSMCACDILSLAGEYERAADALRRGDELLEREGERSVRSSVVAYRAHTAYKLGHIDDAERFAVLSSELSAPDDNMSQAIWRSALAKVRVAQGARDEACELARRGVAIADETDMLDMRGDCYFDLASVLRASGDQQGARQAAEEALALYRRKGNEVAAQRVLEFVDSLSRVRAAD